MIEFVGLVPFLGESHYGLPWKQCVLNFEPSPNRFILGQLYLAFMVS